MKCVGLVDCNNFFVSCERIFRPDLWEKPVAVLSSNDGAVVARSEEVKQLGVPMGVPYFKVRDIFKENNVAIFSSNFDLYRDISDRVMSTLREEVDHMEQYSVDEAFFEMEVKSLANARKELERLRDLLMKNIGVPVSFGLASTKTLAKYANGLEKRKSGVAILTKKDWQRYTTDVLLGELWGVGGAMSKRFKDHRLTTVADLLAADRALIDKVFGIYGLRLREELAGSYRKSLTVEDELPKSIMSTRSFEKTTDKLSVLEEALAYHVSRVAEELRTKNGVAGRIVVMALTSRHSDWVLHGGSREAVLPTPTSDTTVLLKEAKRLVREIFESDIPYKKAGVVLGNIHPEGFVQPQLFNVVPDNSVLMRTVDVLNRKLGVDSVTIGRMKHKESWSNRHEFRSPRYTTSWNELASVK